VRNAIAILLILLLPGAVAAKRPQPVVAGERLEFRAVDLDGNAVTDDDERFRGKVLYITAWATWCPPCIGEIPTLVDLQSRLGEQGLVVVAIAFEHGETAAERRTPLRDFAAERGISYLVLDGGTPDEFVDTLPGVDNVRGLPIEFVVGRDSRVVAARISKGYSKRWARKLEQELAGLLAVPQPGP
jgi:thiol-disulfide isomerase/thioredoxin